MKLASKIAARVLLNGLALYIAERYISGFFITQDWFGLLIAAIVLAVLNTFIRPIVHLMSMPLVWITLGLFNFVIYALMVWIADVLVADIAFASIGALVKTSVIVALVNIIL